MTDFTNEQLEDAKYDIIERLDKDYKKMEESEPPPYVSMKENRICKHTLQFINFEEEEEEE